MSVFIIERVHSMESIHSMVLCIQYNMYMYKKFLLTKLTQLPPCASNLYDRRDKSNHLTP